jgi:hypothetical protein
MHLIRALSFGLLLLAPSVVGAQARRPAWVTLSAGRGDLRVRCNLCRDHGQRSWAADISVGGWISSRTTLGGELAAWRLGGEDATQRIMLLGAVAHRYPFTLPAFIKLGAGLMTYSSTDGDASLSAGSFALQAGVGYDVPVAGRYVVVPQATLVQGINSGLVLGDARVTSWSHMTLVRVGLGMGMRR